MKIGTWNLFLGADCKNHIFFGLGWISMSKRFKRGKKGNIVRFLWFGWNFAPSFWVLQMQSIILTATPPVWSKFWFGFILRSLVPQYPIYSACCETWFHIDYCKCFKVSQNVLPLSGSHLERPNADLSIKSFLNKVIVVCSTSMGMLWYSTYMGMLWYSTYMGMLWYSTYEYALV